MLKMFSRFLHGSAGRASRQEGPSAPPRPAPLPSPVAEDDFADVARETRRVGDDNVIMRRTTLRRDKGVAGFWFSRDGEPADRELHCDRALARYVLASETREVVGKRMTFFSIADQLLFDPVIDTIPQFGPIPLVRVGASAKGGAALTERMAVLKRKGIAVGLADGSAVFENADLARLATVAFFSVPAIEPPDLRELTRQFSAKYPTLQLGACDLQSHEEFDACGRLGFKYFQGHFITRREDWSGNGVAPTTLAVFGLLERMRNGADAPEIAEKIKLHPMLSYRVLRFANSAALGMAREITSIKHALVVIGRDALYRWLVLLLYSTAASQPGDQAVLEAALTRARLMESLAPEGSPAARRENLFLTGMFSLLDVMMKTDFKTLLEHITLPADIRDAILERQGSLALPLQLTEACERAEGARIRELGGRLGVDAAALNRLQAQAARWAAESAQAVAA